MENITYPLLTPSGWAYGSPVTDHDPTFFCGHCKYLALCRQTVCERDGLALCEPVLESELVVTPEELPVCF